MKQYLSNRILDQQQSDIRKYSAWVQRIGGVNLSQGVCDQPAPEVIKQAAKHAIDEDRAIYSHVLGFDTLRQAIASKLERHNRIRVDAQSEIAVTLGSAGGFAALCETLLNPQDNVVTFSPYYSYHTNYIKLRGNEVRFAEMSPPDWSFDRDTLAALVDENTKMILVCTPSNPSGKVFTLDELTYLVELAKRHNCLLVTDEVYEYIVHDTPHVSAMTIPDARERTIMLSGASKTFAITGWRVGYVVGPPEIISKVGIAHDLMGICAPSCLQLGVEAGLKQLDDSYYQDLERDFRRKRDMLTETLRNIGMEPYVPNGAFYMMVNFGDRFENGTVAAESILEQVGVATVPGSIFYADPQRGRTQLRFCYAKKLEELQEGCERLLQLAG